ncbi:MAG: integration host factor subunit beta [Desulfobulbaceae bacterium]|nr:MAG: integration host factor subunit beta [Desulfobulbaceae bacterium]
MNKSKLIKTLAQTATIPDREAGDVTNTILEAMTEALANGDNIEIRGFGSFVVKNYAAYYGRNPKSGEKIRVNPKKLPFFKVSKELREKLGG